jgi:biotin carboxyl carrier protein
MLDPQKISMSVKGELARQGFKRTNNKTPEKVREERAGRLVPSSVLIDRLGIRRFVKDSVERKNIKFSPEKVYVPLLQHVGRAAEPKVSVGDKVKAGDVIAETDKSLLGAVIHASISGTVRKITDRFIEIER